MPTFLIKIDADRDEYVLWSTVVDAPERWGTRAEIEEFLREDHQMAHPSRRELYWEAICKEVAMRFDRADATGTSAFPPHDDARWGHPLLIREGPGGIGLLPRDRLREYLDLMNDEPDRAAALVGKREID